MKTIAITDFKAKCLRLLEQLGPDGLLVTKRGKPIAKILPSDPSTHMAFYGSMKGKIKIKGDLLSTGIKWNAES